jgi:hypothetical protein
MRSCGIGIDAKNENTSVQQFLYILDRLSGNEEEADDSILDPQEEKRRK